MEVTLIYPHQLFKLNSHPAIARGRTIYLIEEPLILTHNPIHRAKLLFHRQTLTRYRESLEEAGYTVVYLDIREYKTTESVLTKLRADGVSLVHVVDTTDDYLERALAAAADTHHLSRVIYDSPLFLLTKDEAAALYTSSKRFMATFYKRMRQRFNLLMEDGEPVGSVWSYDSENRQKLPKDIALPPDITLTTDTPTTIEARAWLASISSEQYGDAVNYLPVTHDGARAWLEDFLQTRFADFGPYEDAITTEHTQVYHSLLSPLMNCGLLTPKEVVEAAVAHATKHKTPIASVEGFIRQIIGWREFIRASYEVDGRVMRSKNFFGHTKELSPAWWTGETGLPPVDTAIARALAYGYTHHIERLMVMGNVMLLSGIHPHETYRWFMGMYIDAYDWVMVPNVYGMSQFADGGSFATKPYISGASYIKKMSNYQKGDWEAVWTSLYWHFIATHKATFLKNHRLAMMPRLWDKMTPDTQAAHHRRATTWLNQI